MWHKAKRWYNANPPSRIIFQAKHVKRKVALNLRRSRQKGQKFQPRFTYSQMLCSWTGSFLAIAILAYLSDLSRYPLIAAPMGATSVLVFGVPRSPLAQPRNVILGNVLGAIIAVFFLDLFGGEPWVMAAAVASTILAMKFTRTVHPPAGAVALVGVMSNVSWDFVLMPVLTGAVMMVMLGCVTNKAVSTQAYPVHWF